MVSHEGQVPYLLAGTTKKQWLWTTKQGKSSSPIQTYHSQFYYSKSLDKSNPQLNYCLKNNGMILVTTMDIGNSIGMKSTCFITQKLLVLLYQVLFGTGVFTNSHRFFWMITDFLRFHVKCTTVTYRTTDKLSGQVHFFECSVDKTVSTQAIWRYESGIRFAQPA